MAVEKNAVRKDTRWMFCANVVVVDEVTSEHVIYRKHDTFGLPELYYVGAQLFRQGLAETLNEWVEGGHASTADAVRIAELIGNGNARRVYQLG